jgi:hypothetical protein
MMSTYILLLLCNTTDPSPHVSMTSRNRSREMQSCACTYPRHLYVNIGQSTVQRVPSPARRSPSFSAPSWKEEQHNLFFDMNSRADFGFVNPKKIFRFQSLEEKQRHPQLPSPGDYLLTQTKAPTMPSPPPRSRKPPTGPSTAPPPSPRCGPSSPSKEVSSRRGG